MLATLFPKVSNKCLVLPVFGPVIEDFAVWLQDYTHDRIGAREGVLGGSEPSIHTSCDLNQFFAATG